VGERVLQMQRLQKVPCRHRCRILPASLDFGVVNCHYDCMDTYIPNILTRRTHLPTARCKLLHNKNNEKTTERDEQSIHFPSLRLSLPETHIPHHRSRCPPTKGLYYVRFHRLLLSYRTRILGPMSGTSDSSLTLRTVLPMESRGSRI
jgi:hypothetical protein